MSFMMIDNNTRVAQVINQKAVMALLANSRLSLVAVAFFMELQTLTIISVLHLSCCSEDWRRRVSLHSR